MMTSWVLYTLALGVLLAITAAGAERVARSLHQPVRFIWAAAMGVSLLFPPLAAVERALPHDEQQAVQIMPFVIDVQRASAITSPERDVNRGARVDALLIAAWFAMSTLLLIRLAVATRSLRQRRNSWRQGSVDGVDVHLAPDAGPAVVGIRSMHVVLPDWILDLDHSLRAMVLRHEAEHRSARDPYLLFGTALAVALMPWNIVLWWQARRLRLAIEMDCDARVLKAHPVPERYGLLLLTIAQRRSLVPSMLAPMLSEPASDLERRIVAMRTTRIARWSVAAGVGISVLALALACTLRTPDSVTGPRPAPGMAGRNGPRRVTDSTTFFEFQVEKAVEPQPGNVSPRYPDSLRAANVEGEVLVQFVVDTSGRMIPSTLTILKSTHPMFASAVSSALPNMQFQPAEVGGRRVKQFVQMPFQFSLSKSPNTDSPPRSISRQKVGGSVSASTQKPARGRFSDVAQLEPVVTQSIGERRASQASTSGAATGSDQQRRELTTLPGVRARPGNPAPRYADALRVAGIEGEVVAQFVVDREGRAEIESFKVLKATDPLFVEAVKSVVPMLRFYPAEVNGQPVKQLTQMPFTFTLGKQ